MANSRLLFVLVLLLVVIGIGTAGYHSIEGFTFIDSLYMTVITVTTVGFQEISPLSPQGKIFTIFLIIGGVGIAVFAIGIFSEWIVQNVSKMHLRIMKKEFAADGLLEEDAESEELFNNFGNKELKLATVRLSLNSKHANMKKIDMLREMGVIVLAVGDKKNRFNVDVPFHRKIKGGSNLLMMGSEERLREFEKGAKS